MKRVGLAMLTIAWAAQLAAAQSADFTAEFQAGIDAFRLGKYDDARVHLEKARSLEPKLPGPHRFLAAVARAQSRWDDCIASSRLALELNPKSSEVADTRKVHDACREAAGRQPYRQELGDSAAIAVTTNVPGATVKINGLTYGGTPLAPRPIAAGTIDVEIDKPGWKPSKTSANALPGIVTDVNVELEPDGGAGGSELDGEAAAKPTVGYLVVTRGAGHEVRIDDKLDQSTERVELEPGTHVVEVRAAGRDPWRRRVRISAGQKTTVEPMFVETAEREQIEKRGLYVIGGGAALLAGGFVFAMLSRSAADEARDIVRLERGRDPSRPLSDTAAITPVRTRADLEAATDRASRWGLISNVTYGAGLAVVGVGAYFLWRGARERTDVPPPFAIAPVQGGAIVATEMTW